MRILVVDDDERLRQFSILCFEDLFSECEIVEAINSNQAIEKITENSEFDIILSDYNMPGGNGHILYDYVEKKYKGEIPYILYSGAPPNQIKHFRRMSNNPNALFLSKPLLIDEYIKKVSEFLPEKLFKDETELDFKLNWESVDHLYKRVRIAYFWRFNQALCDIFIRLSSSKYVKIINAKDSYGKTLIDKYVKRDAKYLYVKQEDFNNVSGTISSLPFLSYLSKNRSGLTEDEREDQLKTTHAILQDLVQSVGIGKNAISMAQIYQEDIKVIAESSDLKFLFSKMKNRYNYLYDHSYILSCICAQVVKKLEWHTASTIEKLVHASLFHDITLNDPDLAANRTIEEVQIKGFSPEEIETFRKHAEDGAKIIYDTKGINPVVSKIVLQHHENYKGTGFPKKLMPSQISPLSCCFIIAHHIVDELYKYDFDNEKIPYILKNIRPLYEGKNNFHNVFMAFVEVLEKK